MKFGAVCAFLAIWTIVVYPPLAHMVWGGEGSFIGETIGALDFAGGDVVHISSGLTGLILCLIAGRRRGFGMVSYRPHNVPFVALGATLLWFGWFGFNAGSEFAADGVAALALVNTVVASGAALASWMVVERAKVGKPTLVGAATGLVAGLVVITPAAGFVEPWAAILMGIVVSPVCYFAISFCKRKIGYDDALDAFGCHCVGGIVGGVLTGLFCVPELSWTDFGGLLYTGDPSLLISQVLGILVTIAFVGVADVVLGFVVKACFKGSLRVSEEEEAQGLDIARTARAPTRRTLAWTSGAGPARPHAGGAGRFGGAVAGARGAGGAARLRERRARLRRRAREAPGASRGAGPPRRSGRETQDAGRRKAPPKKAGERKERMKKISAIVRPEKLSRSGGAVRGEGFRHDHLAGARVRQPARLEGVLPRLRSDAEHAAEGEVRDRRGRRAGGRLVDLISETARTGEVATARSSSSRLTRWCASAPARRGIPPCSRPAAPASPARACGLERAWRFSPRPASVALLLR